MSEMPPIGLGHNRPPEPPRFELRGTGGVSCDWRHTKRTSRPLRFERYWRIYRDGVLVDSFLKKANAVRRLRQLQQREAVDAM